jgi:hypothetical protein
MNSIMDILKGQSQPKKSVNKTEQEFSIHLAQTRLPHNVQSYRDGANELPSNRHFEVGQTG